MSHVCPSRSLVLKTTMAWHSKTCICLDKNLYRKYLHFHLKKNCISVIAKQCSWTQATDEINWWTRMMILELQSVSWVSWQKLGFRKPPWHSTNYICLKRTLTPNAYTFTSRNNCRRDIAKQCSWTQVTDTFESQVYKEISSDRPFSCGCESRISWPCCTRASSHFASSSLQLGRPSS